jgi:hypothetical protein
MDANVIAVVATLVSSLAAGYSLASVRTKRRAEEEFLRELARSHELVVLLKKNRNILRHARGRGLTEDEMILVSHLIERVLAQTDPAVREPLSEAIQQPSADGRRRYLAKVVTEAGEALREQGAL